MKRKVCFIYRKFADTPSIERVFSIVGAEFEENGIDILRAHLPYGNGLAGTVANLLFFKPPEADVYHITGHVNYIALRLPVDKTVLTVHDLGILRNRSGSRRSLIKKLYFDWPFKRLKLISAISQATKNDILFYTKTDPEKVTVVHDPVDPKMHSENGDRRAPVQLTLLVVGTAPHKNVKRVIEAIEGLPCKLLIVGSPNDELMKALRDAQIEHEFMIAKTDDEMREIYGRSDILVFCSTFEGFGLPIVEAQAMQIPVITSDLAPMNEVAGEGAILVDPEKVGEIRNAVMTLIDDEVLRHKLIEKGRANIDRFQAPRIAREYLKLYEQL
jgi:glycosyltransferase involved in cell wall biosynthesis